jgi:lysozyme family protein
MSFDICLPEILHSEGGLADDPDDPGGRTYRGVIQRNYDAYRRGKKLPLQDVLKMSNWELYEIYQRNYWFEAGCQQIPADYSRLQLLHFDCAVNCGPTAAIKLLQTAVGVKADGLFGPKTLAAIQSFTQDVAVARYADARKHYYDLIIKRRPTSAKFRRGWFARVDRICSIRMASLKPYDKTQLA